jgi:hypothetical protein
VADGVVGAVKSFMALCTVWPKPQAVGMMTTIQAMAMRMGEDFFAMLGAAMGTPDSEDDWWISVDAVINKMRVSSLRSE